MLKSFALATYPWVGAFQAAREIVGEIQKWIPMNDAQASFMMELLLPGLVDVRNIPELDTIATWDVDEFNRFFAERGFDIRIDRFGSGEFGIGSTQELRLTWETPGDRTTLYAEDQAYDAVSMKQHQIFYQSHEWSDLSDPRHNVIVALQASNGDKVYMTMIDRPESDEIDLARTAMRLQSSLLPVTSYTGVIFPMIDLNVMETVSWLPGFGFIGEDGSTNVVSQAFQQNILKMNHLGALAKSAAGVAAYRGMLSQKPALVINQPFLFWISRGDQALPLFVAYLEPDSWKDPGDLT